MGHAEKIMWQNAEHRNMGRFRDKLSRQTDYSPNNCNILLRLPYIKIRRYFTLFLFRLKAVF